MFKLIRDNIPEIIKNSGGICNFATAENDELYILLLKNKLIEETQEFLNSNDPGELADVLTVINALLAAAGISEETFKTFYENKLAERGGFTKRYIGFFPDSPLSQTPQDASQETTKAE